ncbi:MAG: RagB/SusD family nutrient uptake outer membrane protein [Bacteroidales bacterium]
MKKIASLFFAASCCFTACDIDRFPYGSMPAETIVSDPEASLEGLLNGCYAQLKGWSDVMHRCGEYAGDNMMIRGTSTDSFYEFISYSRTPNNGRLQTFWDNSYKIIAQSSNILNMVPEGKSEEIDQKLGECYFLRGLMYFYLCRAYGRPYYQSPETNLGVPIVNGTPDDPINAKLPDRSSVKDTYAQAIADLEKAEMLLTQENSSIYGTREAAQAILSRIYLYMSGTYENPNSEYASKCIEYADKVIESGKFSLLARADFMKYNSFAPEQNKETIFAVKRVASEFSGFDHYYGIGGMYGNIGGMGWGEMYASAKYISLLDETGRNDWANNKITDARAAFIEPQYASNTKVFRFIRNFYTNGTLSNMNYVQDSVRITDEKVECWETVLNENTSKYDRTYYELTPVNEEQGIYSINYSDGNTYTGVIDKMMKLNRVYPMFYISKCSRETEESHLHSPIISRLAEVYLNKAEAAYKKGDMGTALEALNLIRERSLPGEGYATLDAATGHELIDKERQLELAYQAERSYDVYRNGKSLTRLYPGPHNISEEVSAKDYRVVYYIPQSAINAYGSPLTQNPSSN